MQTNLPATVEVEEALTVSVNIGDTLVFTADPNSGTVSVTSGPRAAYVDVEMDAEDFALIGELMLRAVGAL